MTIQTAAADQAVFIDRKKPLWLFSLVWLSLPAVGSFVAVATNSELALWIVPIAWFGFIPILDRLCARDQSCPRAVQIGHLDKQLYYSLVVGLAVPIVYATLFYCASVVARLNFAVLGLSLGIVFGTLLTVSRASGCCQTPTEKMLGFIATSIVGFGHFRLAHTVAHQQNCATPV
jgi:alkane 1-monooxygenase